MVFHVEETKMNPTEYLRNVPRKRPVTGAHRWINGQRTYTTETPKRGAR